MHDSKTRKLLDQVSTDISQLKNDVTKLFAEKTQNLPDRARELADYSRDRLHAGGDYASSSLKYLRQHPKETSVGLLGGLLLLGVAGIGIYYLCKSDQCQLAEDEDDSETNRGLPSYIS